MICGTCPMQGPTGAIRRRGCSNRSNISDAKEFSGSQVGSQRRQAPGDVWPHPTRVAAAKQRLPSAYQPALGVQGSAPVNGFTPAKRASDPHCLRVLILMYAEVR
jgi:hypothetical protein